MSYLARERMDFWGPVLDRFVVLTFGARGRFDSGHWVATSEYSPRFSYTFRHDGRVIRGDWQGSVVGSGRTEVPASPESPLLGFWGPLESLLLSAFDPEGPPRQRVEAVDVEDTHHRLLTVTIEKLEKETIRVPAGEAEANHFRTERFGATHHWVDDEGTLLRWSSENDTYRWELQHFPTKDLLPRAAAEPVANGEYEVTRDGEIEGSVAWSIRKEKNESFRLRASERVAERESELEGHLDASFHWKGATETVHWNVGEGLAPAETHHLETFFYRERVHLLRFRDRAYPMLQSRAARAPVPFHLVNYPVSAFFWLREVERIVGKEQTLPELAHIGNRYRGSALEVQEAYVTYLGEVEVQAPDGSVKGHHFRLRYPGGWEDSTFEYWTDGYFIPVRVKAQVGEGTLEYRLHRLELPAPELLLPLEVKDVRKLRPLLEASGLRRLTAP